MELVDRGHVSDSRLGVLNIEGRTVDPDDFGREPLTGRSGQDRLDRPVLAGGEGLNLPLALDHQPDRHRLDATGRQATADLARQQRAQGVADQPIHDPAGLLGVDEVLVDVARIGERFPDRRLGDLAERHPAGFRGGHVGGLGHVPGDRFAFAIEVRGQEDRIRDPGRLLDVRDLLAPVGRDHILRGEVMVDVDAELALARVLGQVADVTVRGEDAVVVAQVAFDSPGLGRGLDDDEVPWHGRECSTGSLARRYPSRTGLDLANPSQEVLVDLQVGFRDLRRRGRRRPTIAGCVAVAERNRRVRIRAGDGPGRDLDEPDVAVREEEDRGRIVDEHGAFHVHRPQVRAAQPDVTRARRLEQVGEQRLLVHDVEHGVPDHGSMLDGRTRPVQPADGPVQGW